MGLLKKAIDKVKGSKKDVVAANTVAKSIKVVNKKTAVESAPLAEDVPVPLVEDIVRPAPVDEPVPESVEPELVVLGELSLALRVESGLLVDEQGLGCKAVFESAVLTPSDWHELYDAVSGGAVLTLVVKGKGIVDE